MAPPTTKASTHKPPAPRLKVVVRRLPPDLPEPVFSRTVQPWVTATDTDTDTAPAHQVTWSHYRQGKLRKRSAPSLPLPPPLPLLARH